MIRGTHWMVTYNSETNSRMKMSYVTVDGNYGSDTVLVFPSEALTEQQWESLSEQTDSDRIVYIQRILNGEEVFGF